MLLSLHLALQALGFSDTSDGELVELYMATRGERYFAELYRRYSPKVYGKCVVMLSSDVEASDAVQDIFEKVLLRIGGFRRDAKFGTWLFTITNNHCIDRLRSRKRLKSKQADFPEVDFPDEIEEDDWLMEQSPEAIKHILSELGEGDRTALILMYMDELSVKEIAETLDIQESATKMRLKRAREKALKIYKIWAENKEFV